jgi:hypothetical protein
MKSFLIILLILGLELWLCFAYPDQVTAFFKSLGTIFVIMLIATFALGIVGSLLASLFSTPPSSSTDQSAAGAQQSTPPPAPRRPSATPFLLGLLLGWWLGGGPGDDSHFI